MRAIVTVLFIASAVGLVLTAVFVPLGLAWRRKSASWLADLRRAAAASGERIVLGPQSAVYRGGSGPYSAVSGNGTIVLTDRRLAFHKRTGGNVEVPLDRVVRVSSAASFRGSRVAGSTHLVVHTSDPAEVGFIVGDLAAWLPALGTEDLGAARA